MSSLSHQTQIGSKPYEFIEVICCHKLTYFFVSLISFLKFNMSCDIVVYGLGVMGRNLALNIASKGFNVAVSNRSVEKVVEDTHIYK